MPGKGGGAARRRGAAAGPSFRRVTPDAVRSAALQLLRRARGAFPSQGELLRAVRRQLRSEEPLAALGGPRLRHLLLATPGVRVDVEFAERPTRRALTVCPVCAGALAPIRNRTLDGERVVLGFRCPQCGYWTHRRRRVPVRYTFRPVTPIRSVAATPASA